MLEYAIQKANNFTLNDTDISLGSLIEKINYGDEFGAAESVCGLFEVN